MNNKIKQKRTDWQQHIDRKNNERLTKQIRIQPTRKTKCRSPQS